MSHCKKVRDLKADIKRVLRWARQRGYGGGDPPVVMSYMLPGGSMGASFRFSRGPNLFLRDGTVHRMPAP